MASNSGSRSVAPGTAASASPVNVSELQLFWSYPSLPKSETQGTEIVRG